MSVEKMRSVVFCSLMAGLMAAGAFIQVPLGPVPIVLTNLFVLLAGLLLGARWGAAGAALYLLVGAIGLPVFSGGQGRTGPSFRPYGRISFRIYFFGLDNRFYFRVLSPIYHWKCARRHFRIAGHLWAGGSLAKGHHQYDLE